MDSHPMDDNYREVLFFPEVLKEQVLYPDMARDWLTKACENRDIDRGIFNHNPDGSTINRMYGSYADNQGFGAIPAVCIDGGKGFIRLNGFGTTGRNLVLAEAGKIMAALSDFHGKTPCRIESREGRCFIRKGTSVPYYVKTLGLSKRAEANPVPQHGDKLTLIDCIPLIQKTIYRGIIGQALMLDEELGSTLSTEIPTQDMLDIQVFGGKPTYVRIKEKSNGWVLVVDRLIFSMNLRLEGPWLAGRLRAKGYGRIRFYRGQS